MGRILYGLVITILLAMPAAAADGKVSGVVVDVRPDQVILEEQGPWSGPGTGIVGHTIEITPRTVVRFVRPTGQWEDQRHAGLRSPCGGTE